MGALQQAPRHSASMRWNRPSSVVSPTWYNTRSTLRQSRLAEPSTVCLYRSGQLVCTAKDHAVQLVCTAQHTLPVQRVSATQLS
eukprot:2669605-Rhodomonas_salina.1